MRVERLPEYVTTVTVTAAGIAFALYCGTLTGSGQTQWLMMLLGAIATVTILMTLRTSIWVLIPIAWVVPGVIPALPLGLGVRDAAILLVTVAFLMLTALKVTRFKPRYTALDVLLLVNLAYLATVFVRNPVGVYIFQAERVGGRPYFTVAIAFLAYWVLSRCKASTLIARVLPWLVVSAAMLEGLMALIAAKAPQLISVIGRFYSSPSFAIDSAPTPELPHQGSGRNTVFTYVGPPLVSVLYSRFSPWTLINPLYIFRFLAFLGGMTFILYSGFRSMVVSAGVGFLISSYLRHGLRSILFLIAIGTFSLTLIVTLHGTVFELPLAAQRAHSVRPGRWDHIAVAEARHSTDWRLYMWKTVLSSDRYIQSKWLGDGFGFTTYEMNIMARGNYNLSPEEIAESYMVMGEYHSGPITAVRFVGVIGTVLFIWLLIAMAIEALRLIKRAKGGPYQFMSFFVGIPVLYQPFNFIFVYGGYKDDLPAMLFTFGMLKVLGNSLDDSESEAKHLTRFTHSSPSSQGSSITQAEEVHPSRRVPAGGSSNLAAPFPREDR